MSATTKAVFGSESRRAPRHAHPGKINIAMGDNRKQRREQAEGFQKEMRERIENIETTQHNHGETIWRQKRRVDEIAKFTRWKIDGSESMELIWKDAVVNKNGGYKKVKEDFGEKLAEELCKHLGFAWPLPEEEPKLPVVGEEEVQVDTDKAKIWGALKVFVDSIQASRVTKTVHQVDFWAANAVAPHRVEKSFLINLMFGVRALDAAAALTEHLEQALRVASGEPIN